MPAKAGADPEEEALASAGAPGGLLVWAWGLVGFATCAVMAPLEPSLLEEGLIFHLAERMLAGERLFSELASFTGPLPFHLLALLFDLFGAEVAVARGAIAVLAGLSTASVFALARDGRAGALAHLAACLVASGPVLLFPLHSTYFYSTLAYHLALIAAYATSRGLRSSRWSLAAGLLIAGVALCKQGVGALLALGLVAAVFACAPRERRLRSTLGVMLGGAGATLVTLGYYGAHGELGALVQSLLVLPLGFETAFESPFIDLWPPGELSAAVAGQAHFYTPFVYSALRANELAPPSLAMTLATQLLYALPFIALLATAARRSIGALPAAAVIHAAVLLALASGLFPRTDWGHLVFALAPAAAQLVLLAPSPTPRRTGARAATAALCVALLAATTAYVGASLWARSEAPNLGPRVPIRPVSQLYRSAGLARVVEHLARRVEPEEAIFVARAEPLVYFATGTRNPTPYSGVIPGTLREQGEAIVAGLEQVRFVVMSEIDQPVFTYYRDLLPGVVAYLERHFRVAPAFEGEGYDWILVLERRADRGPTAIDLFEQSEGARAWTREEDGALGRPEFELPALASSHNRRPLPVLLGRGGGGIDYAIEVPEGAVFESDVGLGSIYAAPVLHARDVACVVSVARSGAFERLLSIDVLGDPNDGARWRPIEVDLAAYAGERVTLRLEIAPRSPLHPASLGWWGSPRIALRPGAGEAAR